MEVYEVICGPINEPRSAVFAEYETALSEADRICRKYHIEVEVVLVIGKYIPDARWMSNGIPGHRDPGRG